MAQSYEHHAHQPIPTYLAGAFWLLAVILLMGAWSAGWGTANLGIVALALSVLVLISISRQYTVKLQDRIIMLEMKVRCAEVLPAGQDALLAQLSPKQVAALRFASDEELGPLLERAVRERMAPADIKRAVKQWRPDLMRT